MLIVIAIACAVLLIGAVVLVVALAGAAGGGGGFAVGPQIGVIHVEGVISAGSGPSLFSVSGGSDRILEEIKRATEDKSVKAYIIRINSPGGAAGAAQEIHEAIVNLRKKSGKPVIVSMGDVAASGGYYVAAAGDKIVANPATMTGSIGVAMDTWEIAGLMDKYGVGATAIISGKYKDTGSMFRKVRPDERELMQQMVDDVYQQFLQAVYEGRRTHLTDSQVRSLTNGQKKSAGDLTVDDFKRVADGRMLTGHQAHEKGLVDELGGMETAVGVAKQAAGIQGNVQLKDYSRRAPLEELFGGPYGSSETQLARDLLLRRDLDPVTRILRAPTLSIR